MRVDCPRVLVFEHESLLGAGIEHLLASAECLEVVGYSSATDEKLARAIQQSQPDAVIVDEVIGLEALARLMAVLDHFSELQLIMVNRSDNLVRIYGRREVRITQASDLVSVIRDVKS